MVFPVSKGHLLTDFNEVFNGTIAVVVKLMVLGLQQFIFSNIFTECNIAKIEISLQKEGWKHGENQIFNFLNEIKCLSL